MAKDYIVASSCNEEWNMMIFISSGNLIYPPEFTLGRHLFPVRLFGRRGSPATGLVQDPPLDWSMFGPLILFSDQTTAHDALAPRAWFNTFLATKIQREISPPVVVPDP